MRKTVQPIAWPAPFEVVRDQVRQELEQRGAIVHRVALTSSARSALRSLLDDAELRSIPVQQIARWMTGCEDVGVVSGKAPEVRVCVTGQENSTEVFSYELPGGPTLQIRLTSED